MTDDKLKLSKELEGLLHCLLCDLPLGQGATVMHRSPAGTDLYHKECFDKSDGIIGGLFKK